VPIDSIIGRTCNRWRRRNVDDFLLCGNTANTGLKRDSALRIGAFVYRFGAHTPDQSEQQQKGQPFVPAQGAARGFHVVFVHSEAPVSQVSSRHIGRSAMPK
jgi:hypothetical protein